MPDEENPDVIADVDAGDVDPGAATAEFAMDGDAGASEYPTIEPVPTRKSSHGAPVAAASGKVFSGYGIVSTAVGLVAVAALVFGLITWSWHRADVEERGYRSQVLQTAASWTSVLINLNAENVEKGMAKLRDKTVGELNAEFDAAVAPYRDVVQRIQSRSTGRIEAVAIETERHNPDDQSAEEQSSNPGRTDPVIVIATSIAENVGGRPQTVHWALRLDVTSVGDDLMISRLRSIR